MSLIPLLLSFFITEASAQGPVMCPTRPPSDSSNACANTAWVKANGGGGGGPAIGNAITGATANYGLYSDSASKLGQFAYGTGVFHSPRPINRLSRLFPRKRWCPWHPTLRNSHQRHRPTPYHRRHRHLPIANGGTGTTTPALTAGTNITITGTWPNNTISASSTANIVSGTTTITGTCTSGQFMYNNSGVVGCSASSASISFPQSVTGGTSGAFRISPVPRPCRPPASLHPAPSSSVVAQAQRLRPSPWRRLHPYLLPTSPAPKPEGPSSPPLPRLPREPV